ncbi:MAG TPA: DegV family protein [Firmicutes bacterium]|jgi:DegV family protein with EDD domain|nr:DegV family protein [Bacillota bacterium]HBK69985.1 DegV family protein [Bacillota bacterium]HBT16081.1 DegV family protein [Bacillota bacterium]
MGKIALVTDSTADLTEEMKKELNVHVIPLKVRFAEQEFKDGELTAEGFYTRLANCKRLPTTSQPSPEDFISLYRKLFEDYDEIISIHLSSGLSGTLNSAYLAKEKLKQKIHIIDSKNISLGIGILVKEAAKLLKEGLASSKLLEKLTATRKNIETLFTLNTLEYLHKGGRIGKVPNLLGSLLNIKPIVRVNEEGIYVPQGIARSQERALKSIVNAFHDLAKGRKPSSIFVAHGAAFQAGLKLKEALEEAFQLKVTTFTQVGPVIGVHTGPGTVGAAIHFE